MQFSTALFAIGVLPFHSVAPVLKRALSVSDVAVLQLALFLERLEFGLFTGGYQNFTDAQYVADGFLSGFRDNIGLIASHEANHATMITHALEDNGVAPKSACTYMFPYSSPATFVALANMVTSVGIGAYIGGAAALVDNQSLLTDTTSISTNEARHDAYLRTGLGASPFPTPYDTSLEAVFAYNLAYQFVVSCPDPLPLPLLPQLNLTFPKPPNSLQPPILPGTTLAFVWNPTTFFVSVNSAAPLYIALINQNLPILFQEVTKTGNGSGTVQLPSNISGVAFALLTTFSGGLNQSSLASYGTLAGPAEVILA